MGIDSKCSTNNPGDRIIGVMASPIRLAIHAGDESRVIALVEKFAGQSTSADQVVQAIADGLIPDIYRPEMIVFCSRLLSHDQMCGLLPLASSQSLNLLCRRLVTCIASHSRRALVEWCSYSLLGLLSHYTDYLKLTWSDLLWILDQLLSTHSEKLNQDQTEQDEQYSNHHYNALILELMGSLQEFLECLSADNLSGEYMDFAIQFAADADSGPKLLSIITSFLKNSQFCEDAALVRLSYGILSHLITYANPADSNAEDLRNILSHLQELVKRARGGHHGNLTSSTEQPMIGNIGVDDEVAASFDDSGRKKVVHEIISTEESYVSSLEEIRTEFITPIRQNGLLDPKSISMLFSNIEIILDFHQVFLPQLKQNKDHVAGTILAYADFLKMYTQYVNAYDKSIEAVCTLKDNDRLQKFFKSKHSAIVKSGETPESRLMSHLIKPIQRIPRYLLLLKELLKQTPVDHPEYDLLRKAVEKIAAIAEHVNLSKKRADDFVKLINIQSRINSGLSLRFTPGSLFSSSSSKLDEDDSKFRKKRISLIKPHRKLVKEETLVKLSRSAFRKQSNRRFYLFNDSIMWMTTSTSHPKIKGFMELSNAEVRMPPLAASSYMLEVLSGDGHSITLVFKDEAKRDEWQAEIIRCIEALKLAAGKGESTGHYEKDVSGLGDTMGSMRLTSTMLNKSQLSPLSGLVYSPSSIKSSSPSIPHLGISAIKFDSTISFTLPPDDVSTTVVSSNSEMEDLIPVALNLATLILALYGSTEFLDEVLKELDDEASYWITTSPTDPMFKHAHLSLDYWLIRLASGRKGGLDVTTGSPVLYRLLTNSINLFPSLYMSKIGFEREASKVLPLIDKDLIEITGLRLLSQSWSRQVLGFFKMLLTFAPERDINITNMFLGVVNSCDTGTACQWEMKACTALLSGLGGNFIKNLDWISQMLSSHSQQDRRVTVLVIWALRQIYFANHASPLFLNDGFIETMLATFSSLLNKVNISLDSDFMLVENVCELVTMYLKQIATSIQIGSSSTFKIQSKASVVSLEMLSFHLLSLIKPIRNLHSSSSLLTGLLDCISMIFSVYPQTCSARGIQKLAFPALMVLIDGKGTTSSHQKIVDNALMSFIESCPAQNLMGFAEQIFKKSKQDSSARSDLIFVVSKRIAKDDGFIEFIKKNQVENWLINQLDNEILKKEELSKVIEMTTSVILECWKHESESALPVIKRITTSIIRLTVATKSEFLAMSPGSEHLLYKCLLALSECIYIVGAIFDSTWKTVLGEINSLPTEQFTHSLARATLGIYKSLVLSNCLDVLSESFESTLSNVVYFLIQLCDDEEIAIDGLNFLGDMVTIFGDQTFENIQYCSATLISAMVARNPAIQEASCYLLSEIAKACQPEEGRINWETRKYLCTLLAQNQNGLIYCLSKGKDHVRVALQAAQCVAQSIVSLEEQFVPFLASMNLIQKLLFSFPLPYIPLVNSKEDFMESNLLFLRGFETIIQLRLAKKCRSRDFMYFIDMLIKRFPAVVELAMKLNVDGEMDLSLHIMNIGKSLLCATEKVVDPKQLKQVLSLMTKKDRDLMSFLK